MELAIIIGIVVVVGAISTAMFVRRLKNPGSGCSCQGQSSCTQRKSCGEVKDDDQQA